MRIAALALLAVVFPVLSAAAKEDPALPAPRTDSDFFNKHELLKARASQGGVDVLFLGDSITEFWADNAVWRQHYAPLGAANFGIAGDKTQNVLWRLTDGELDGLQPKVVVLLIGTNDFGQDHDSPDEVARGVTAVLASVRQRLPEARVLLLGIFPRDDASAPPAAQIASANAALARLDDGDRVRFLDLTSVLAGPDGAPRPGLLRDGLHPTEEGYGVWADAMDPLLHGLLTPPRP